MLSSILAPLALATLVQSPPAPAVPAANLSAARWEASNLDGGPAPAGTWTVRSTDAGEVIHCSGGPTGFLASRASYRTMTLEFEWRWPEKAGNSGLLLFTETLGFLDTEGKIGGWPRNLEVQLQSGDAGHFVVLGPGVDLDVLEPGTREVHEGERIRGIFRRRAVDDVEKPVGEWNRMRVEVGLDEIVVYVNGTEVNRGVGGSLTAAHPNGFRPGPFAFQSEGTPIQFRNIEVKGTPTDAPRALWDGSDPAAFANWEIVGRKGEHLKAIAVAGAGDAPVAFDLPGADGAKATRWFAHESMVTDRAGGALFVSGRPSGYIRTRDALGPRYHLSLEWAWAGDRGGNSGVLVHTTQPDVLFGWPQSMEVQLQSGSAGDFWVIGEDQVDVTVPDMASRRKEKREGDLHSHRRIRRVATEAPPERPVGQWNRMDIELQDDRIRVFVNGRMVNDGSGLTVRAGAISLQSEGSPIRFRNVFVR